MKQKSPTDPIIKQNVCGRIRTSGTFQYTSLAGKHHKPLGHANITGWGRTRTCVVSLVTDLQSAGLRSASVVAKRVPLARSNLAARHTHPWGDQGESNPHLQSHNLLYCCCTMANVTPAGLEPSISGLRGRCPHH